MNQRVLVVDDDSDLAEVLAEALAEFGYEVDCAADGAGALARLTAKERPAAIILDLMMPRMDGWAFLEAQAADESIANIPVIVLTGQRGPTKNGRSLDADVVLEKPVKLFMLVDAIRRFVAGSMPGLAPTGA